MSCEHEHTHGHGGHDEHGGHGENDGHSHVAPVPTSASQSLLSKVDIPHVRALNMANPPEEVQKLFKTQNDKYRLKPVVRSDCDAQLILHIPFVNSSVKLHSLILRTNGDKYCPKTIKLWKNDKAIDFDNCTLKRPTWTLKHPLVGVAYNDDVPEILESDDSFVEHYLPRHLFTGVQHLTVFVEDIHDDSEDESHLHYVELRGEASELLKDPVITLYELAPNPADHKRLAFGNSSHVSLE